MRRRLTICSMHTLLVTGPVLLVCKYFPTSGAGDHLWLKGHRLALASGCAQDNRCGAGVLLSSVLDESSQVCVLPVLAPSAYERLESCPCLGGWGVGGMHVMLEGGVAGEALRAARARQRSGRLRCRVLSAWQARSGCFVLL